MRATDEISNRNERAGQFDTLPINSADTRHVRVNTSDQGTRQVNISVTDPQGTVTDDGRTGLT
jgi:hypothetical protein